MKTTKITALAALLLALAPAAFAAPTSKIVSTKGEDQRLRFEWDLSVVQIDGLSDAQVEKRVNEALRERGRSERASMAKDLKDWESTSELGSSLGVHMTVGRLDDQVLSVSVSVDTMYSGAAHPNVNVRALTFDLRTGEEISSGSMFGKDDATRARLAALLDERMRADVGNYWNDSINPDEYRYRTVEPRDLTDVKLEADGSVTFFLGEIGPRAAGLAMITVPASDLAGLVAANGPIAPTVGIAGALPGR
jgi:hypothetical protein